jgi:L-asparagine transporter-like permease
MDMNFILASIGVFLVTILVLVVILLVAKNFLVASGNVKLTINGVQGLELYTDSVYRRLYLAFKGLELIRFNLDEKKNPLEYSSKINTVVDDVVALLMKEKEQL